jgi:hypothetical protein
MEFELKPGDKFKLLRADGEVHNSYHYGPYIGTVVECINGDNTYRCRWDWSDHPYGISPKRGSVPLEYDPFWKALCECGKLTVRGDYLCESCRNLTE